MDLNQLSNEELMNIAGISQKGQTQQPAQDLNSLNNDELMRIAGIEAPQPQQESTIGEIARPFLRAAKSMVVGSLGSAGDLAQEAINLPYYLGYKGAEKGKELFDKYIKGESSETLNSIITGKKKDDFKPLFGGINTASPMLGDAFDKMTNGLTKPRNKTEENLEVAQEIAGGIIGPAVAENVIAGTKTLATNAANKITEKVSAIPNFIKNFKGRGAEELEQAAIQLKDKSNALYKQMRDSNAMIRPQAANRIAFDIEKTVADSGKLNPRLHGDTLSVLGDIKDAVKSGPIGLEELDQYRQLLSDVVTKNTDIGGKLNPDAFKATLAINKLDDVVDALKPEYLIKSGGKDAVNLLNSARQQYKSYRKFDSVLNLVKQADGDPNRLKAALQRFVNNPKKLRGFTQNEVESLKSAAANSTSEKLLKSIGKFGFDLGTSRTAGNTFLPASFSIAGAAGAPGAAPLVAAGTVARQLQKYSALGKVDNVFQLIQGTAKSQGQEAATKLIAKIPDKKIQKQVIDKFLERAFAVSNAGNLITQPAN